MRNVYLLTFMLVLFITGTLPAQTHSSIDEKLFESLHGHGSLNVVVAVLSIILIGLFVSLFRIERKVNKLEKELHKK